MKYEQTHQPFEIPFKGVQMIVVPIDGETSDKMPKPDVSWSHGITHFYDIYTGKVVGWSGINWFENNAVPVDID